MVVQAAVGLLRKETWLPTLCSRPLFVFLYLFPFLLDIDHSHITLSLPFSFSMAQIGKLRNHSGLRLDLNSRPTTPCSLDDDTGAPSLKPSTSTESSGNWREDLARIVSQNRSQSKLAPQSDEELKAEDFENVQKLGEGAAGVVWKVRYKATGLVMAKKVHFYIHKYLNGITDKDIVYNRQLQSKPNHSCNDKSFVSFHF